MATTLANSSGHPVAVEGANGRGRSSEDPFTSTPTMQSSRPQRYSIFDSNLFSDDHPSSSPSQAKRALEAHLAETDRRLSEASKLGTTLVEQRQKLSARLREVESQQNRNELGPELRQRLIDIEKEYNEVGRESARAFLGPKTDLAATTGDLDTPFALDGRVRILFYVNHRMLKSRLETCQPCQILEPGHRFPLKAECTPEAAKSIHKSDTRH